MTYLVQFGSSVVSDSLWSHGLQHARLSCPSLSPGVCSKSRPLSQWCHPTISSCVTPFSSCPQSFLASGFLPVSRLFASKRQKYWSFSFSISPSNEYSGLISFKTGLVWFPCCPRDSQESFPASKFESISSLVLSLPHGSIRTSVHDYKVLSLLLNMLSRLVITFLPRSKRLNFMAAVTICSDFGAPRNKVWHYFYCFPIYFSWSHGTRCHDLRFLNVEL